MRKHICPFQSQFKVKLKSQKKFSHFDSVACSSDPLITNSMNISLDYCTWNDYEFSHSNLKNKLNFPLRTSSSVSKTALSSSVLHHSFLQLLVSQNKMSFHSTVTSISFRRWNMQPDAFLSCFSLCADQSFNSSIQHSLLKRRKSLSSFKLIWKCRSI